MQSCFRTCQYPTGPRKGRTWYKRPPDHRSVGTYLYRHCKSLVDLANWQVTAWWKFSRRLILREAYKRFRLSDNSTDSYAIRFVVGQPEEAQRNMSLILRWEQETFRDLHIIEMEENMNEGKSYEYFASLARWHPSNLSIERPWDYAMKLDDDSFLNIPNLLEKLRPLIPRTETWFVVTSVSKANLSQGRGIVEEHYMFGPGYVLSWDLVTWLGEHREDLAPFTIGSEDRVISEMLKRSGKAERSWLSMGMEYMSLPSLEHGAWTRELGPDVILVHPLKSLQLLSEVINYFFRSNWHRSLLHLH